MRTEDEIKEYKNKIEQELALKIARAFGLVVPIELLEECDE